EVWQRVRRSPDVRCVVVTGGMNSFSAGRDLKETAAAYQDGAAGPEWEVQEMDIRPRASRVEIPVIAAIDGYCLGAGLLLAMDCDIRISSESATFGNPQVRVGRGTEVP